MVVLSRSGPPSRVSNLPRCPDGLPYRHQHRIAWQGNASTGACKGAARAFRYLLGAGRDQSPSLDGTASRTRPMTVTSWYGQRAAGLQVLPVSSALCAQARSESPRAVRGQTGRRIRMSNSETRGSRFSHLRELPGRPFASSRCPVPAQANNIVRGIRLRADLAACKG